MRVNCKVYCGTWFALAVVAVAAHLPASVWAQATDVANANRDSRFVPSGYTRTFSDDFDILHLDPHATGDATWVTYFPWTKACPGFNVRLFPDNKNQQLWVDSEYGKDGKQLDVTVHEVTQAGTLRIYGKRTPREKLELTDGLPYVAGVITTQCSFWQKYGYIEGRMRFAFTKGHHCAFWMLPKEHTHAQLELDIVERVGKYGKFDRIYQNSHGAPQEKRITSVKMEGDYRNWATYGLKWTPTTITWFVNGKETRRVDNYIHEPMYLIVALEIGGTWPGRPDEKTKWPAVIEIDYIRAYEKMN